MKKLDVVYITRQLNQLRMKNPQLKVTEFREEISKFVGYSMFSSLLLEENYAYLVNGVVRFSPTPIHKSKVETILNEAREIQYKYSQSYLSKKKNIEEKMEEEKKEIEKAINFLKGKGYLIIKSENLI